MFLSSRTIIAALLAIQPVVSSDSGVLSCNPMRLAVNDLVGDKDGFNVDIIADELYTVALNGTLEANITDMRLNGTHKYVHSYDLSLLEGEYVVRAELEVMHAVDLGVGQERRTTLLVDDMPLGFLTDGYRLPVDVDANLTTNSTGIARIDVFDLELLLCYISEQGDGVANLTVTIGADDGDYWALDYSLLRIYTCDGYLDHYEAESKLISSSNSTKGKKAKKNKKSRTIKSTLPLTSPTTVKGQCKTAKKTETISHSKMGMSKITKSGVKGRMYVRN